MEKQLCTARIDSALHQITWGHLYIGSATMGPGSHGEPGLAFHLSHGCRKSLSTEQEWSVWDLAGLKILPVSKGRASRFAPWGSSAL